MAGFITTDDGGWEFSFEDEVDVPDLPAHDPFVKQGPEIASYLAGPGKWENYCDNVIYELESLLRKFLETKLTDPDWTKKGNGGIKYRKYTCGMMFEQLYGRPYDRNMDGDVLKIRRLSKLMAYYSTRIQKEGSIWGKKIKKSIYLLSLNRYKKIPPYSLKIRLDWLKEKGELPCWQNMKLPKDDLKKGHARNPNTEENMRIRRERAKEQFNRKYNDKRDRKAQL